MREEEKMFGKLDFSEITLTFILNCLQFNVAWQNGNEGRVSKYEMNYRAFLFNMRCE